MEPRWRIVYKLLPDEDRPEVADVMIIGPREDDEVYVTVMERMGRPLGSLSQPNSPSPRRSKIPLGLGFQAARCLAGLVGGFGLALAAVLVVHATRTAADGVHSTGEVAWIAVVATVAALAASLLLLGVIRWTGPTAWWLRLAGVAGLLLVTLSSWVLPLFAPLAFLALPSLVQRQRTGLG